MITLITGATRSGKSEWAELLAERSLRSVIYVATALRNPTDLEWEARLQRHSDRRPVSWHTWEVPRELAASLGSVSAEDYVLVDSLGTWVANLLDQEAIAWNQTEELLLKAALKSTAQITFVAEEVGWGVVPAYETGRIFRDRLGHLVRELGAIADLVYLVAGGQAINLTRWGERLPSSQVLDSP